MSATSSKETWHVLLAIYLEEPINKEVNMAELGEQEEDTAIPSELPVPKYQASELASEAAKLKSLQVGK